MKSNNLISQCGLYCGACRQYLLLKKDLLEARGYKRGCEGCLIRDKNCTFFKKQCAKLRKREVIYCFECKDFPCDSFNRLEENYTSRYGVSLIGNLKTIRKIGVNEWVTEQKELYRCPKCDGEVCVHDEECYDCNFKINPNKLKLKNEGKK
ncbi:MAG: DUF3795 domain-containing protein [Candidatus Lokiarchaeota archaeon]|nr:DUF3795 domain-containing protein [Candidatus Lokiarchaeota archaeon]MBD3337514.1 DUF3795 domain-containing protein [Candidatus Lokiarchaeota archaeon]